LQAPVQSRVAFEDRGSLQLNRLNVATQSSGAASAHSGSGFPMT
jgi:hypothetical protein